MFNGTKKRWEMVVSPENSGLTKCFAMLEILCFYLSMATLGVMLVQGILVNGFGYEFCNLWVNAMKVLLAAAVGFLTNWLAIEMLFKPYEYKKWLLVWPQGLIQRNKSKVAEKAGDKISSELLDPKEIANRLCGIVSTFIQSEKNKEKIGEQVKDLLRAHENSIVEFLIPQIEASLIQILQQNVTSEKFRLLWDQEIVPRLTSDESRDFIANHIAASLRKHSPELVNHIKTWVRDYVFRYIQDNFGGLVPLGTMLLGNDPARLIAEGLVNSTGWNMVENMIKQKLENPGTINDIKATIDDYICEFRKWLESNESSQKINSWVDAIKEKLRKLLSEYLRTEIPKMTKNLLDSPKLWNWINDELLANAQPQMEVFIRENAPAMFASINFREIITQSIEKQDVKEFENMVNDVAAEHLGAIQVLGFILGGIIGVLQLWI